MRCFLRSLIVFGTLILPIRAAEPQTAMPLEQAIESLRGYDAGGNDRALHVIERHVGQAADPAARAALARRLATILAEPKTSATARVFVCQQLLVVGSEAEVPVLAKMLDDPATAEIARFALDAIPGEASLAALRGALERVKGPALVGAINSMGLRRDVQAVPALVKLLAGGDPEVAAAAAEALGKIASPDAAAALVKTQVPAQAAVALHNAQLQCAERLAAAGDRASAAAICLTIWSSDRPVNQRTGALAGLARADKDKALPLVLQMLSADEPLVQGTAMRLARELPGEEVTRALAERLPRLDAAGQVLLLGVLADRGDRRAAGEVAKRMDDPDEAVRVAAIEAMARLGSAAEVDRLVALAAAASPGQQAARASLARLCDAEIDGRLMALAAAGETALRVEALRALAARASAASAPALLKAATDADPQVRLAAWDALAAVAGADSYAKLVPLLVAAPTAADAAAAQRALLTAGARLSAAARLGPVSAALADAPAEARLSLIRVLGGFGGPEALSAVRPYLDEDDPALRDAAVRALAHWPDLSVADDLLKAAQSGKTPTHRILALRGYLRLAGEVKDASARLKLLERIRPIATTVEAKRMLLAGLAEAADPGALHVAAGLVDDAEVQAEATVATLKIARGLVRVDPAAVRAAMRKLMDATKDKAAAEEAALLEEEALKAPSPEALQQALRYDKKRSDAQKAVLAKRAPKGFHLACYLDCGPDGIDGAKGAPVLRLAAGGAYFWPESAQQADPRLGTVFFDGQRVVFEAAGLDPKKAYQIGFTWWDYDHNTRAQSVLLTTGKGQRETQVLEKAQLPSGAARQGPEEKTLVVPADLYADGTLRISFRNEAQPNVVVSELWLWEADAAQ